jgi:hypothetical protein
MLTYSSGGNVGIAEENDGTVAEMLFSCGNVDFKFNVKCNSNESEVKLSEKSYVWEFNDLNEIAGLNNLTLSEKSVADQYSITDGILMSANRQADFSFAVPLEFTSDFDWSIEWSGVLNDNGIILGNSFSTKGYIYLAPYAQNMGYSIRLVDNNGQTFYLPYGDYAEQNGTMNNWKIAYKSENKTISLYLNDNVVTEHVTEKPFLFNFTNMLGRYGSDNVNYCYVGSLDSLRITFLSQISENQGE